MGDFSTTLQTAIAFFHSKAKTLTEGTQAPYEALYKSAHSARAVDIWGDTIAYCVDVTAADSEAGSNSAVTKATLVTLTAIPGSNGQAYYYNDGGTFVKPWVAPTDIPHGTTAAPAYGFQMQLYQSDNTLITPTEGRWVIDYYAGVVQFESGYTPSDMGWGAIKGTIYHYAGAGVTGGDSTSACNWTLSGSNIYYNGGNVGIGTTNPTNLLHVVAEDARAHIKAYSYSDTPDHYGHILMGHFGGTEGSPTPTQSGDTLGNLQVVGRGATGNIGTAGMSFHATQTWTDSAAGCEIRFTTVPNDSDSALLRMTITQAGRVGIGVSDPESTLEVYYPTSSTIKSTAYGASNGDGSFHQFRHARGSRSSPSYTLINDRIGTLNFHGWGYYEDTWVMGAQIDVFASENYSANSRGAYMSFKTAATGETTETERMLIDSAGKVKLSSGTSINQFATTLTGTSDDEVPTSKAIKTYGDANWSGGGGGGDSPWNVVLRTGAYTAVSLDIVVADTSGGIFTVTLPLNPSLGDMVKFANHTDSWETYNLTVGRNGQNIKGVAEDLVVDLNVSFSLIFTDATEGWVVGG